MKPYIIGEFEGIPFEVNNRYQVTCENQEAKKALKELVIEGLKEYNKEKSWSKLLPQFYITSKFERHKELPLITRRIFEYKGETIIEHIEDRYTPYNPPAVSIEGILTVFPFKIYTDLSVECKCPEPDGTKIANWVRGDLNRLSYEYHSADIPDIHYALCRVLMKQHFYKIQKAFIYKINRVSGRIY